MLQPPSHWTKSLPPDLVIWRESTGWGGEGRIRGRVVAKPGLNCPTGERNSLWQSRYGRVVSGTFKCIHGTLKEAKGILSVFKTAKMQLFILKACWYKTVICSDLSPSIYLIFPLFHAGGNVSRRGRSDWDPLPGAQQWGLIPPEWPKEGRAPVWPHSDIPWGTLPDTPLCHGCRQSLLSPAVRGRREWRRGWRRF